METCFHGFQEKVSFIILGWTMIKRAPKRLDGLFRIPQNLIFGLQDKMSFKLFFFWGGGGGEKETKSL